jgi:protoheme ferro-lyase
MDEARRCLSKLGFAGGIFEVRSFWDEPGYLKALSAQVSNALEDAGEGTRVLFSAHGLPLSVARRDTYPGQVVATAEEVARRLGLRLDPVSVPGSIPEYKSATSHREVRSEEEGVRSNGQTLDSGALPSSLLTAHSSLIRAALAWQSKVGPMRWLEPPVESVLEGWGREGVREIVLVPLSFVNEHSETLYELDVLYSRMAAEHGITVRRVPTLGTAPAFIRGLAHRVRAVLEGSEK